MSEIGILEKEYLTQLPEKLDRLEELTLEMEKGEGTPESFNETYGILHTLKGTSGSYGLQYMSSVCHQAEDYLELLNSTEIKEYHANQVLLYVDVLREIVDAYINNAPESEIKSKFNSMLPSVSNMRLRCLVIENTQLFKIHFQRILEDLGFVSSFTTDGYKALGRLMNEKFDCMITSEMVSPIKGSELIDIIKAIEGPNQDITTVLMTSNDMSCDTNYIIQKDAQALYKLKEVMQGILDNLTSAEESAESFSDITPAKEEDRKSREDRVLSRILYVDDDTDLHPLVKMGLKKLNGLKELRMCSSGAQALEQWKDFEPDLIILDYVMPELDGPSTFIKLKEEGVKCPVIFLTGKGEKEVNYVKKLGAQGVLKKPFNPNKLAQLILDTL
jgi:CheY-like chemotaxis protein/HPt (histidine-containing phosphotransfer) domain-containing protein